MKGARPTLPNGKSRPCSPARWCLARGRADPTQRRCCAGVHTPATARIDWPTSCRTCAVAGVAPAAAVPPGRSLRSFSSASAPLGSLPVVPRVPRPVWSRSAALATPHRHDVRSGARRHGIEEQFFSEGSGDGGRPAQHRGAAIPPFARKCRVPRPAFSRPRRYRSWGVAGLSASRTARGSRHPVTSDGRPAMLSSRASTAAVHRATPPSSQPNVHGGRRHTVNGASGLPAAGRTESRADRTLDWSANGDPKHTPRQRTLPPRILRV